MGERRKDEKEERKTPAEAGVFLFSNEFAFILDC